MFKNNFLLITIWLVIGFFNISSSLKEGPKVNKIKEEYSEYEVKNGYSDNNQDYVNFIPSEEWQEVKDYHKVPAGLHIRMNLETGLKEAKLLSDGSLNTYPISKTHNYKDNKDNVNENKLNAKENTLRDGIIDALKNIKNEDPGDKNDENRKNKFRSYEKIKSDFDSLQMKIESEAELLSRLVSKFEKASRSKVHLIILEDLSYLVHQIDNAVYFVQVGGLSKVVARGLNATSAEVRGSALALLGAATQSNPKVQVAALEEGMLSQILKLFSVETSMSVCSKAVFALSCLVRGFPYSQQRLVDSGGMETLRALLRKHQSLELQIKVINLVSSLLEERTLTEGVRDDQLRQVDLPSRLSDGDWCEFCASLVTSLATPSVNDLDHDSIEKSVMALRLISPTCRGRLSGATEALILLEKLYGQLARVEVYAGEEDRFFESLWKQIDQLRLESLRQREEL